MSFAIHRDHVIVIFTLIVFSGVGLCVLEIVFFQHSVGVKASLVESRQMYTNVICSFYFLSFRICFLSCSFQFTFLSFLRRYAQTGHVSILPSARMFVLFGYRFCYRVGGLCRLPSSGFMNMCMYKFVIIFFTLIVFLARNAVVVLRCRPRLNC